MTHRRCMNIMNVSLVLLLVLGVSVSIATADVSDPFPRHQQLLQSHTAWPSAVAAQQHPLASRMRRASYPEATPNLNAQQQAPADTANPLLASGGFPLWDTIRPGHIQPAINQLIEEELASLELLEQDLTAAAATGSITFDRVFKPLTQITLRSDSVASLYSHLSDVVRTDALRTAVDAVTPAMVDFRLKLGQSKPIHDALKHLQTTPQIWQHLSQAQQRLVNKTITDMAGNGVGLEPEQRAAFNQKKNQLEQLQNKFSNNVLDAKGAFKLLVAAKATLAGLGSTTLDLAANNARDAGHLNATGESGPWLLKLDSNTYAAVMSSAHSRELRQTFYIAEKTAASSGQFDNTQTIRDILQLRQELAAMLGYSSWGDYKSTSKMATIKQATALMQQMVTASQPAAAAEHQQLTAFARAATNDPTFQLQWWDVDYYSERQKEQLFNLKQQELQEYLPLDSVIRGLFKLAEMSYGVNITKAPTQPPVWHKDVTLYQVTNTGSSTPIAYFYTDLFARPGSKSGGAWEHGIRTGSRFWLSPSPAAARAQKLPGGYKDPAFYTPKLAEAQAAWLDTAPAVLPTAIIVCNQSPPVDGKPSLMNLREVETLFHEFGHAAQDMLTTSEQGLTAGIRNIELDAVEIPSMMQEKWVYDPSVFSSIAQHWQTGQPLPDSMFKQIAGLHKYRQGTSFSLQLSKALTDLKLHSSYDVQTAQVSPSDIYIETLTQLAPMPPWSGDKFLNQFRHLFYYGYEAGYYSYYWADIISADIHGAFAQAGMNNATAVAQVGQRYRDTFLSLGGSVHPNEVFQQFMGRAPSIQAWLEYNGLL